MSIKTVKKIYSRSKRDALAGRFLWHHMMKQLSDSSDTLTILMPSTNKQWNHLSLSYLDQVLEKYRKKKAFILTVDSQIEKKAHSYSDRIEKIVLCPEKKIRQLIKYIILKDLENEVVIVSLEEPYGRFGDRLVCLNRVWLEDVFLVGVFGLEKNDYIPEENN